MYQHNQPSQTSQRRQAGLPAGIALLLILALLTACAGTPTPTAVPPTEPAATTAPETQPTEPAPATEAAGEPVTVTWLMFHPDVANDTNWQDEINLFNETHTDMKLEIIGVGWNDFAPKLQSMIAAGTPPDVVAIQNEGAFVSKGFVMPLDDLIAQDIELDRFVTGGAEPAYDGKIYGFRHDTSYWMLYYNKDMFDAAGIPYPPAEGYTLDEFMDVACQLTKPEEGVWGMHNINWLTGFLAAQSGLPYLEMVDGVPQYRIDDPETMAFYQKIADFINTSKCQPSADDMASLGGADPFIAGKTAMQFNGNWAFGGMKDNATFSYAVSPLPGLKQPNVGMKIGIVSTSKNQEAAWEFVKWLTYEPDAVRFRTERGMGQPALNDQVATDVYLSGPTTPEGAAEVLQVFADPSNGLSILDVPGKAEADNIINPAVDEVMNGTALAVDVIPAAVQQANELMAETFKKETGQ
jgi:multiple sugar transport system substrate-binding protein